MTKPGYYRSPTLRADTVVFVCEDDLWTVPASGGTARRLTANPGAAATPALSPDGAALAFSSHDEGNSEVYLMLAEGGEARRLTYLGAETRVAGWTPDGSIVFASNAAQPFGRDYRLYTLSPEGGEPQGLPYGPAMSVSYGPGGGVVIGRNTTDIARWKRYRGGTAGELWVDSEGRGAWRKLVALDGNLALPLWLGERVYFVSDHQGTGNLYSCTPQGEDLQRHTHHRDFYVRGPATDGTRIVYQAGADLYLFDPEADASERIPISFYSPKVQRKRKFVEAPKYLRDVALNPKGTAVALSSRGQTFSMTLWEGPARRHGDGERARYRLPVWLGEGRLAVIRDLGGEAVLELHETGPEADPTAAPERLEGLDLGRPLQLIPAPKGDALALTNHRNELLLVELAARTVRQLDRSRHGQLQGVSWSPDGRYLAYGFQASPNTCGLRLCEVASGDTRPLTEPVLWDFDPSFDPDGRFLYFSSYRTFDPVYDNLHFDLGFPKGGKPYLITLQADTPSPFTSAGQAAEKESEGKEDPEKPDEAPRPTHIDLHGITDRIVAFPVPEGRYSDVRGLKGEDNKVLYLSHPVEGALQNGWYPSGEPAAKATLELYDLGKREQETLVEGVTSYSLSGDASTLVYRAGNRLRVLKAGDKPPEEEGEEPGRKSGWLDLGRVKVPVDPAAEWRGMFRDAWRLQLEHFWTADMSGIDWEEVYRRYEPLLERVASRGELSDLLWEMQGELGTSHAYELGGDYRESPEYPQGFLGADLRFDPETERYMITNIVRGDPWDEEAGSPLARPGVNASVGNAIVAVNGQRVSRATPPGSLLVHQAESEVFLTLAAPDGATRTVVVKTLKSEQPARYRAWVEANRRYVHHKTEGRVGYVHVPDMGPHGYAEFHRGFLKEAERTGLVVDVRFNGGGHVSQLILEKLARKRLGYDIARWSEPRPFPDLSLSGPLVALTNEHAGSDGDIFCHTFKLMNLGPLVGKRTWGGVVGITVNDALRDGTVTTQPEFSFWFKDVGFGVENYGTDPTIDVDNRPQDYASGADPQLERATQEALKALSETPFELPDFSERPRLAPPLPADD